MPGARLGVHRSGDGGVGYLDHQAAGNIRQRQGQAAPVPAAGGVTERSGAAAFQLGRLSQL